MNSTSAFFSGVKSPPISALARCHFPTGSTRLTATIDNCWLQGNGNGGLAALTGCRVIISNSIITSNTIGIAVEQSAGVTECNVTNCVIAHNATGLLLQTGAPSARLSDTTIVNNNAGIQITSGVVATWQNNKIAANATGNDPSPGAVITQK